MGHYLHLATEGVCIGRKCIIFNQKHPVIDQMRKAYMIVHQVREPFPLSIRLLTEFIDLQVGHNDDHQRIAFFILYTKNGVYEGRLSKIDVNVQLAWNQQCITALTDALSGKKPNIQVKFREEEDPSMPTELSLICEIQTGINVRIFQINMFRIEGAFPMTHMRRLFMEFKDEYAGEEKRIKQERERLHQQMKEMAALQRQIQEQTVTEIAHLKKNFLDVVNDCKKQLRKHMKTGISDIVNQQEEPVEEQTINKRRILKVDRQQAQAPQRTMAQNEYMDMLFDP